MMLEIGTTAIDFTLPDEQGNLISLHSFKGKKIVLYFYPKDNTPGCSKQACAFKAAYDVYKRNDIIVIGISKDSSRSHLRFKEKYDLPFILLSDEEHKVIEAYDVWKEKKNYGKVSMGVVRTTYLIDEEGVIIQANDKVKAAEDPEKMLAEIS